MKRLLSLLLAFLLCFFLFACGEETPSVNQGGEGEQSNGLPVGDDPALPDRNWD